MDKKELDFILQEGEGFKIEFKEAVDPKNLPKDLVAFANFEGGRILIGVNDKGEVKGIEITNKLKSGIQNIARNCDPSVHIELETIDNVLIINVGEGKDKPYKSSQGFFIRQGSNSQKMKRDEIIDFISEEGKLKFDRGITDVNRYDSKLVSEYLKKAGIKQKMSKDTLFNLGVADKNGFLNNAGILFFIKEPKQVLINAYVTCARYKGTEKINVIDRKDFEEDLVTQVEQAVEFVKRNTRLEYEIKGLYRKEIPEYPIEAVREAILNAVMHRDYLEKGANVQVDIFDDKLTVTNIGGLIKPLTKEKLGTLAVRRNPLIADLFHRIHLVEKMGTGINRIKEECKKHGNVNFEIETNGYFIARFKLKKKAVERAGKKVTEKVTEKIREIINKNISLPKKELGVKLGEKLGVKLGENEAEILRKIMENRLITSIELSEKIGISTTAIENNLSKLKKKKLLKRVGPDKGGYWEVIR